jgi:hypothetical protein
MPVLVYLLVVYLMGCQQMNDWMTDNNEFERTWKNAEFYLGICLVELRRTTKNMLEQPVFWPRF